MANDGAPVPVATPTSTPVANGATPEAGFHAGGSFHEFQARLRNQAKPPAGAPPKAPVEARTVSRETPTVDVHPNAPPPKNTSVVPQPGQAPVGEPPALDPNAPAPEVDPNAPPPEQAQTIERQLSPEDFEKWEKIRQAIENKTLPDEFADMLVPLKNGDQIEYETLEEVRNGRMRHKDHMRGVQQRDQERAQESTIRKSYEDHFHAIGNPETGHEAMYEIYTRNGMRPQLKKLAEKFAAEEQQDIDNATGVAYAVMMRLGIQDARDYRVQEARNAALQRAEQERLNGDRSRADKFEMERLRAANEQRQEQGRSKEEMEVQRRQLSQLRPRALEAVGLDVQNPIHVDTFNEYLHSYVRQDRASKITPELAMKAARAARDEMQDREARKANGGAPPQRQPPRGFVPQLGVGGGGARQQGSAPGSGGDAGWTADAFAAKFMPKPWQKR